MDYIINILATERNNLRSTLLLRNKQKLLGLIENQIDDESTLDDLELTDLWNERINEISFAIRLLNGDNEAIKDFFKKIDE